MKLVHRDSLKPVQIGDVCEIVDPDEKVLETWVVTGFSKPTSPAFTGRVYVHKQGDPRITSIFFPSVFNMEWINREDRGMKTIQVKATYAISFAIKVPHDFTTEQIGDRVMEELPADSKVWQDLDLETVVAVDEDGVEIVNQDWR